MLGICYKFLKVQSGTLPRRSNNDNLGDQQGFFPPCVLDVPRCRASVWHPSLLWNQTCHCHISPLLGGSCCMPKRCLCGFMTDAHRSYRREKTQSPLVARAAENGLWAGRANPYPGVSVDKLAGYTLSKPPASKTCRSCLEKHLFREIERCGKILTLMG